MKNKTIDLVLSILTFSLTIFFGIPMSIYMVNRESILAHDAHIVGICLFLSAGAFLVVAIPLLLLGKK